MTQAQRLDAVCEVIMGQAPDGESYNNEGVGWPLIAGAGDFGDVHPAAKKFTTQPSKLSRPGDILLGIRATVGEKVLADGVYCLGRGVAALRAKDGLDDRYLWHWLSKSQFELAAKARGATFKQVSRTDIGELRIPLPPASEQHRIAHILDGADRLRAKRRAALAQLDTLTESIFLDMFGDPATNPKRWPVHRIGDLLQSATYGTSAKAGASGEFPVLRMSNITRTGDLDLRDLKFIDVAPPQRERYLVRAGDILFNRTNSPDLVGKTGIYRNAQPMAYAGYLVRLRVHQDTHPEYLAAFMNSRYAKRLLRGMGKTIIGMANINAKEVQGIPIQVPPSRMQEQFACRAAAVEQLKVAQRASLFELDALFASLQHRAFRGEL